MALISTTTRLTIRRIEPSDAPFIHVLLNTPGWIKYIGDRNVHTDAEALAYLEKGIFKSYADNGYGFYQVDLKEGNIPIGICGIVNRGTLPGPDFGFAFLPEYMGKGLATEASLAVLEHVKSDLGINELYAITLPDNQPSIRLLERLGFTTQSKVQLQGDPDLLLLYRRKT
jgi:RimJ/RimL family protein N-acetyltransferase